MKINQPPIKGPLSHPAGAVQPERGGRAGAASAPASGSAVELSATARHMASLAQAEPPVNQVKVDEIRAALADGTLQIDPDRIADGLLASARELLES